MESDKYKQFLLLAVDGAVVRSRAGLREIGYFIFLKVVCYQSVFHLAELNYS